MLLVHRRVAAHAAAMTTTSSTTAQIRFDGRVALVTGGTSGLGRAHVLELARRGATVLAVSRSISDSDSDARRELLADASTENLAISVLSADVSDEASASGLVEATVAEHGRLDILINNAGSAWLAPIQDGTTEQLRAMIDVHLMGTFWTMVPALRHMRRQGSGRIVNTVSGVGLFGRAGSFAYATAKGGVHAMTRCAALDNAEVDIKVNAICPIAATPMAPSFESIDPRLDAGRMSVERVAPVVAYLAHASCSFTGRAFHAAGGRVARTEGVVARGWGSDTLTAEDVAAHLGEIADMNGALAFDDSRDQYAHVPKQSSDFAQWNGSH